jgi:hypothetical protein
MTHCGAVVAAASSGVQLPSEKELRKQLDDLTKVVGTNNRRQPQDTISFDDLAKDMEELARGAQRLEELMKELTTKRSQVEELIQSANARQIENLARQLENILDKEMKRRTFQRSLQRNSTDDGGQRPDPSRIVSLETFHERFDANVILRESDVEMKDWIMGLVREELDAYKKGILSTATNVEGGGRGRLATAGTSTGGCPTTVDIVQKVQQSLRDYANDGIGLFDHAKGAQVVHWMTTGTYDPPPKVTSTLGSVWWRKYIPQDWERLLPNGWENWNVGIPSYLYHSLVRPEALGFGDTYKG